MVKTRESRIEAKLAHRGEVKLSRVRDVFDGDMEMLRNEAVEKVDYVVVGVDAGRKGQIRIRIKGVYYSVMAMINPRFGSCAGMFLTQRHRDTEKSDFSILYVQL